MRVITKIKKYKPILKAKRLANRVSNNIDDYYETSKSELVKYRIRKKVRL